MKETTQLIEMYLSCPVSFNYGKTSVKQRENNVTKLNVCTTLQMLYLKFV